jgi:altronate hydrolase
MEILDPISQKEPVKLTDVAIHLHPEDPVAVARQTLLPGLKIWMEADAVDVSQTDLAGGYQLNLVEIHQVVPAGHKLAIQGIEAGEAVKRYGQVIGFASRRIEAGEHVHTHNLGLGKFEHLMQTPGPAQTDVVKAGQRSFMGYRRPDGRAGTRNYIAVVSTVNCSAHVVRQIARWFTPERLAEFINVDGVIALTHPYGCGVDIGGENYALLQRTLAGTADHPNVAGSVVVGLGCEGNQAGEMVKNQHLDNAPVLVIQELGGVRKTVDAGIAAVERLLPLANTARRVALPVSELTVALQCGGSDGWSGVTANPLVGLVADEIVRQGGAALLAETPEIYGSEHLLTGRAVDAPTAEKLLGQVRWWEEHTRNLGTALDTNRSPGNAAGGLTTIYEKALGAVSKGGSTPLTGVYEYAERITRRGLGFMNSPGNDAISVTGQVAGGCNLVLFTTGRGSVFGFKPAPSIKISTNSDIFRRMEDDMDFNAGMVLEGKEMQVTAGELFELLLAVASGQPSKSEAQGIGEAEFSPWFLGGVL